MNDDLDQQQLILPFTKIKKEDRLLVGLRGFTIGLLEQDRIPVPNGFVITTKAFSQQLSDNEVYELINSLFSKPNPKRDFLEKVSRQIKKKIISIKIPHFFEDQLRQAYSHISGFGDTLIAVKPSSLITLEKDDGYAEYLNIKGIKDLLKAMLDCWASQFNTDVLEYALDKGIQPASLEMAVIIQKMVQAEASGVVYTGDLIELDDPVIQIEAILGLADPLLENEIVPDYYVVSKESKEIIKKHVVRQDWMIVRQGKTHKENRPNKRVEISPTWKKRQKIDDKNIKDLASIASMVEKRLDEPLDIEWVYEGGKIWIVQVKPKRSIPIALDPVDEVINITKTKSSKKVPRNNKLKSLPLLLYGDPGIEGVTSGEILILKGQSFSPEDVKNKVVVISALTTDLRKSFLQASALILDSGEKGSETYVNIHEINIPSVLNTQIGTQVLEEGEIVTVSGHTGEVYKGVLKETTTNIKSKQAKKLIEKDGSTSSTEKIITAMKVFANYSETIPEHIDLFGFDGVAPISSKQILGRYFLQEDSKSASKRLTGEVFKKVAQVTELANPAVVIYRLSEYVNQQTNSNESEFDDKYLKLIDAEIDAVKNIRNKLGLRNISLCLPPMANEQHLRSLKKYIFGNGLKRSSTLKLYATLATPANIVLAKDLFASGIDGALFDANLLCKYSFGLPDMSMSHLNEKYVIPLLMDYIKTVIKSYSSSKTELIVVGDIVESSKKFLQDCVREGVFGVSVHKDALSNIKQSIKEIEHSLLARRARVPAKRKTKLKIRLR